MNRVAPTGKSSAIHSTIVPADVRPGEPIKAFVKVGTKFEEVTVWRLSPLGAELVKCDKLKKLSAGDQLEVEICVGKERTDHLALIVDGEFVEGHRELIAIRFYQEEPAAWKGNERRNGDRWGCSSDFLPNGVCPNPGKFNDFLFFKVTDISSSGFRLETSLRNKFLVRGMTLKSTVTLPMIGHAAIALKIENASISDKGGREFLMLGCSFVNPSQTFLKLIGQYLFQFGPAVSLKELSDSGLSVEQIAKGVEFKYVRTKAEFEQVLELRKLAYGAAGKLASEEDVTDIYDARARIIIGLFRGKVVASTRLIFNEIDQQMEHEQFVTFDSTIPNRDQICEITRVCTHPDFRGADLLAGLLKFISITVAQSGRYYILGCSTDSLLPMYMKMGFQNLGIKFTHGSLNNVEHTIFMCDVRNVMIGRGVGPIVWNVLWSDASKYMDENQILKFDPASNVRIGVYRLLRPIALLAMNWMKVRRKSKSRFKKKRVQTATVTPLPPPAAKTETAAEQPERRAQNDNRA